MFITFHAYTRTYSIHIYFVINMLTFILNFIIYLLIRADNYFLFAMRELLQGEIKLSTYIFHGAFRKRSNFGPDRGYIDDVINDNGQYRASFRVVEALVSWKWPV